MDSSIANSSPSSSFTLLLFFHKTKPSKANPPIKTGETAVNPTTSAFLLFSPIFGGLGMAVLGPGLGPGFTGTSICKVEFKVHDFTVFFSKFIPVESDKPIATDSGIKLHSNNGSGR